MSTKRTDLIDEVKHISNTVFTDIEGIVNNDTLIFERFNEEELKNLLEAFNNLYDRIRADEN